MTMPTVVTCSSVDSPDLAVALTLRPRRASTRGNPLLLASVGLNVVLALLAVWWAPLRELLRTEQMSLRDLAPCLVAACVAGAVARLQARRVQTTQRADPAGALGRLSHDGHDRSEQMLANPRAYFVRAREKARVEIERDIARRVTGRRSHSRSH
jgi:hypothetical protein